MSIAYFTIEIKKGINNFPFGASTDAAKAIFGAPSEQELIEKESDNEPETQLWYYDDEGFSLFFEGEPDLVLTSIEINNQDAILLGKKVFELNEDGIIELMRNNGFTEMYAEDTEWGERLLSFEDALIDFYFEEGKLITINWSAEIEEE